MTDTGLTLSSAAEQAIRAHGRETYPHECCGALLGADARVDAARPLANTTEEGPRRRFLVRSEDYQQAEAEARERGLDLLGFYHSHPDHPAVPSQYDLDHAWPFFAYVIVAVANGVDGDMRSWRLADDRSRFDEESVTVRASSLNLSEPV